jgi:Cdc6-like AAA superfamily ATPase
MQDILGLLPDRRSAYINCQTFEQITSAEQIMHHILKQLRSVKHRNSRQTDQQTLRRRANSSKHRRQQPTPKGHYEKRSKLARSAADRSLKDSTTKQYTTFSLQTEMSAMAESTETPMCAVWNFGRELKERSTKCGSSVIIMDHADLIFSKVGNNKNLLSQLLLLPQVFDLNLTIVLITNTHLLLETRIDNLAQSTGASISADVHPIVVYFPPYRLKEITSILQQPLVRQAIVGMTVGHEAVKCPSSRVFADKAYHAYVDSIVQTIQGRTSDVKEIIQLARSLWQTYVNPLSTLQAQRLIEDANKPADPNEQATDRRADLDSELILLLDKKARVLFRELGVALGNFKSRVDAVHHLPVLAKYLLLSAYLCRANHADKDKQLFSMQKNGRRKQQRGDRDEQEEAAFGSSTEKNPSTLVRPRTFPLERVLSVYVSIVGLQRALSDEEERSTYLGDFEFNNMLCHLCEAGLLHEHPVQSAGVVIRMTDPRYYTTITDEEAKVLAKALNFQLDKYT